MEVSLEVRVADPVTTERGVAVDEAVMVSVKLGSGCAEGARGALAVTVRIAGVTVMLAVAVWPA